MGSTFPSETLHSPIPSSSHPKLRHHPPEPIGRIPLPNPQDKLRVERRIGGSLDPDLPSGCLLPVFSVLHDIHYLREDKEPEGQEQSEY